MSVYNTRSTDNKWFYNLDGLRFFAAVLVILGHIEILKKDFRLPTLYPYSFFTNAGPIAVTFFFVLSGFLISYLLIQEHKKKTYKTKKLTCFDFIEKEFCASGPYTNH